MSPLKITALAVSAIVVITTLSSRGPNVDQLQYVEEYCARVDMYELDVMLGKDVSDIRGHRDFKNLCEEGF